MPEVYHEVDASRSGTCVQWNMDNNQWRSFIEELLMGSSSSSSSGSNSDNGVVNGHGLPLKLFDEYV